MGPEAARTLDRQDLLQAGAQLFDPGRGLWVAPIRHHSPACAWALTALIRAVKPTHVLIEGPEDFTRHIDTVLDPETRPPVAIIALTESAAGQGLRIASHYPLSTHSPEFVALREGRAMGATLGFIDLSAAEQTDGWSQAVPGTLQDDRPFTSGDYVDALCRQTGCRDGHDLWDHLFEARLGSDDWQGFFADVAAYCSGLRLAGPPDMQTLRREARMAGHVRAALAEGGRVVAVVGGYHAPAITAAEVGPDPAARPAPAESYLVRYGFAELDALGGYGAGLPLPGYYDRLWSESRASGVAPAWRETAMALLGDHATGLRRDGHVVPLPALVEALRLAEGLAALVGRPGPMRQDLLDAVQTAMVKGEASERALWTSSFATFLRGDRIGQVCRSAGQPPLVADARARATALRFAITDSTPRDRRLEVRRKATHRAASAYLHAMEVLGTGFGKMTVGPDYDQEVDLVHLHEHWTCGWSARVEARLIEVASHGDTVPRACAVRLMQDYDRLATEGRRGDLPLRCRVLGRGILAGLGSELDPLADRLSQDIAATGDFAALALVLRRLLFMASTTGPLRAPAGLEMARLVQTAFHRLVWLIDGLGGLATQEMPQAVDALRLVSALVAGADGARLDGGRLAEALDRLEAAGSAPPMLLGAVLGLGVLAGKRDEGALGAAVSGGLRGMDLGDGQSAFLAGMLRAAPAILCRDGPVLDAVDAWLARIDERQFMDLLPELRHAFSSLTADEVGRLAAHVARRHGLGQTAIPDQPALVAAGRALQDDLHAQGLQSWLAMAAKDPA